MKYIVILTMVMMCILSGCAYMPTGEVAKGVHFIDKDVSGYTKTQVEEVVKIYFEEHPTRVILEDRNGEQLEVSVADLGITFGVSDTVEAIRQYGYETSYLDLIRNRFHAWRYDYQVQPKIDVNDSLFHAFFNNYMEERTSTNAGGSLSVENGTVVYIPPKGVEIVDEEYMRQAILEAILQNQRNPLPVHYKMATEETEEMKALQQMNAVLSSYTTYFYTGASERSKNVALATRKISGTLVRPGEIFSYNAVVGERTSAEGYEMAPVYINGKLVPGIGGGICQVSSTLFAAALYAGLEIVERTTHFEPVGYTEIGMDATVSYGSLDFAFRNNLSKPIYVLGTVVNGSLTVTILGSEEDVLHRVAVEEVERKTFPHGEIRKEETKEEPAGTVEGHDGIKTTHRRTMIKKEGTVSVDYYDSYYEPVDTVIVEKKKLEHTKDNEKDGKILEKYPATSSLPLKEDEKKDDTENNIKNATKDAITKNDVKDDVKDASKKIKEQ